VERLAGSWSLCAACRQERHGAGGSGPRRGAGGAGDKGPDPAVVRELQGMGFGHNGTWARTRTHARPAGGRSDRPWVAWGVVGCRRAALAGGNNLEKAVEWALGHR
jgi:hypothetical protein